MEFQLTSVNVEERYPRALPAEATRDEMRADNAFHTVKSTSIEPALVGCVAFLWGRTAAGDSVCVRVEGVRPRLYFELSDDETVAQVCHELQTEVDNKGIVCAERTFCHFYGYEPDATTPSRRREHRYVEASYPSLATWRRAVRLRRHQQTARLTRRVDELTREDAERRAHIEDLRVRGARHPSSEAAAAYRRATEDYGPFKKLLDLLTRRAEAQRAMWEDFDNEHGRAQDAPEASLREAQEWFVDPTTRFLQETGLVPCKWVRLRTVHAVAHAVSVCDVEVECALADVAPVLDRDDLAPVKHCYYDIETTGLTPTDSEIIQVSLVFRQGLEKKRYLVGTRDYAPIAQTTVCPVADEGEILRTMQRIVLEEDPDSLVAYNGVNFDNYFLEQRATTLKMDQFRYLSRFAFKKCFLRELKLQSSGMGDNLLRYFDTPGRSNYDWYIKLKRDLTQEDSYKLDYMGQKFCGKSKVELASGLKWRRMTATMDRDAAYELVAAPLADALRGGGALYSFDQREWRAMEVATPLCEHHWVRAGEHCYAPANTKHRAIVDLYNGTAADRARLGHYCVEDSELLDDLDQARVMTVEIYQFAAVFGIVPEWVYFRGQQVRFVAQLLKKARVAEATPLLLNRPPDGFQGEDRTGFEGAVVNEPIKGFHKRPVGTLDWKSLYPAIMISSNFCHSTCVIDPAFHDAPGVVRYDIAADYQTYFVSEAVHRGICPQILEELAVERKNAKNAVKRELELAKSATTEAERLYHLLLAKVYDARQLAIKVSMNSIYGACGTSVDSGAKFPCIDISATVTHLGRTAMQHKKRILGEAYPGLVVIYGDTDSIMIQFEGVDDVEECGRLCEEAAALATRVFREELGMRAMELEFEKVFKPYLLEGKKRYMGVKYEPDGRGGMVHKGIDAKGVETERKDTLPYVKIIMRDVRDALMIECDEAEALRRFRARMDALVRGEVSMELLTLRKNLSSKVEHKTDSIVQARVNAKRRAREAGSEAQVNEQVEYVIVNGHKDRKTTELAEDPTYAKEHGLKLNLQWYFEHCIRNAMKKMLEFVPSIDYPQLVREYTQRLQSVRLNVNTSVMQSLLRKRPAADA